MDLKRLRQIEKLKADLIDDSTARFVRDLTRSLAKLNARAAEYARDLSDGKRMVTSSINLSRANASRAQIEEILLEAGYRDDTRRLVNAYDRIAEMNRATLRAGGLSGAFTETDVRVLTSIKDMDLRRWEGFGNEIIDTVHARLLEGVVSGGSFREFREAMEKTLLGVGEKESLYASRAKTLANTFSQSFDRAVTNNKAAAAGIDTFVYVGPDDSLTRPFCNALLSGAGSPEFNIPEKDGAIYTLAEIEDMQNGTALSPLQYGGGFNCRHSFRPISVEVAQELNA